RSVREHLECEQHAGGRWITALETRMHPKKVTVAVTAKRVRVCWVILRRGVTYQPRGEVDVFEPRSCGAHVV
ncbi:MAG: hypothetical protein ACK5VO_00150, partial [Betaproteobacteria bacterium]